jgi:hypothetical protein
MNDYVFSIPGIIYNILRRISFHDRLNECHALSKCSKQFKEECDNIRNEIAPFLKKTISFSPYVRILPVFDHSEWRDSDIDKTHTLLLSQRNMRTLVEFKHSMIFEEVPNYWITKDVNKDILFRLKTMVDLKQKGLAYHHYEINGFSRTNKYFPTYIISYIMEVHIRELKPSILENIYTLELRYIHSHYNKINHLTNNIVNISRYVDFKYDPVTNSVEWIKDDAPDSEYIHVLPKTFVFTRWENLNQSMVCICDPCAIISILSFHDIKKKYSFCGIRKKDIIDFLCSSV